jgi:hypothetical protein
LVVVVVVVVGAIGTMLDDRSVVVVFVSLSELVQLASNTVAATSAMPNFVSIIGELLLDAVREIG